MSRRRHLLHPDRGSTRFEISWCGRIEEPGEMPLADEPGDADCLRCLAALERDAAPPDEIESYLRHRAYSRALSSLRDRHRDEFDELLEQALVDVVDEEARARPQDVHTC